MDRNGADEKEESTAIDPTPSWILIDREQGCEYFEVEVVDTRYIHIHIHDEQTRCPHAHGMMSNDVIGHLRFK